MKHTAMCRTKKNRGQSKKKEGNMQTMEFVTIAEYEYFLYGWMKMGTARSNIGDVQFIFFLLYCIGNETMEYAQLM